MKITLGIDFNVTRTIVCSYNEHDKIPTVVYNQPTVGYIPQGLNGSFYFGEDCLHKDYKGRNLKFNPTIKGASEEVLKHYFDRVLTNTFKNIKDQNIVVEYLVFTDSLEEEKIKRVIFSLTTKFKEIKTAKLIFGNKTNLLNNTLVYNISRVNKLASTNLLVLNLDDFSYDFSLFAYKVGELTPKRIEKNSRSFSYSNITPYGEYGSFAFCKAMIDHCIDRQSSDVSGYLKDNQDSQVMYVSILNLLDFFSHNKDYFYKTENPASHKINVVIENREYGIFITKEDYDYAVEKVIYGKNDSLRDFLMKVEDILDDTPSQVICYGSACNIIDVNALIASIFGYKTIIKNENVFITKPNFAKDFVYHAWGASLLSSLSYKGVIPKITFVNYRGNEQLVLGGKEQLLASNSITGLNYYAHNKEYNIPLQTRVNFEFLEENKAIIIIDGKKYNLYDYIYKNYEFNTTRSYIKMPITQAIIRFGIVIINDKPKVLINVYSKVTGLSIEFILGKEV